MGHSWSQGLFTSLDGKDEESTSEDINLYYAMSLWGKVTNRPELDQLGQLMLTIARRSIQNYFLLEDDNKNHPRAFVGNKVTGILFENKVDHTTYFSARIGRSASCVFYFAKCSPRYLPNTTHCANHQNAFKVSR
jgi:endo-1,3(4)-beta-glucanase